MPEKTLVIPDIHLAHKKAQKIIDKESADRVVFLGDYFDDFNDTPDQNIQTAAYVKENWLYNSNCILLMGNHDANYAYGGNPSARCSGYSYEKSRAINSIWEKRDWEQLKFHTWLKDIHGRNKILLTHAGFSDKIWRLIRQRYDSNISLFLNYNEAKAHKALRNNLGHWTYQIGESRGGRFDSGGICWADFTKPVRSPEFKPIFDVDQIVGHSFQGKKHGFRKRKHKKVLRSENWCIDTALRCYAIWNEEKVEIKYIK